MSYASCIFINYKGRADAMLLSSNTTYCNLQLSLFVRNVSLSTSSRYHDVTNIQMLCTHKKESCLFWVSVLVVVMDRRLETVNSSSERGSNNNAHSFIEFAVVLPNHSMKVCG